MLKASDLFELPDSMPFTHLFYPDLVPWDWLNIIKTALNEFKFEKLITNLPNGLLISGKVYIHPSVKLPPFGSITGPAYIGERCELRPGVLIRGNVITGKNCVLGNSCEFKNCLLLDNVQVPHFSYVGDCILGNQVHLGAGVICSNLRLDKANVPVILPNGVKKETNLRKLGALIGDYTEVGCNAVLNPGSIIGKRSLIMPGTSFSGTLAYKKKHINQKKL